MHKGEVAHSEFLIARGDAPRLFEAAHAPLDSFALPIVLAVEVRGAMAAAFALPALRVREFACSHLEFGCSSTSARRTRRRL